MKSNYLKILREQNPLIHNITNIVVANYVANGLLSIGASPIIGSVSADLNRDNGAHLDTWVQHKNEFVATQESGTMTFRASGTNPTAVFVGLDGVKITQVPEPSSAILIALGGLTLITRRKRQ